MPRLKHPRGAALNRVHPLARGLAGCWVFNEGGGLTVWNAARNDPDTMDSTVIWSPGNQGSCLQFNGANKVTIAPSIVLARPFSIVCSVYPIGTGSYQAFTGMDGNNGFYRDSGNLKYWNSGSPLQGTALSLNTWYAVAVTHGSGIRCLYKNGLLDASGSQTGIDWTVAVIACRGAGEYFTGKIGYMYFYNRVLSASEIAWLSREPFAMLAPGFGPARVYVQAGAVINLAGVSASQSVASASLKLTREIGGSVDSSTDLTAIVKLMEDLLGVCAGASDVTAALKSLRTVAGGVNGLAGVTGGIGISGEVAIAGAISAAATVAGALAPSYCSLWASGQLQIEAGWIREGLFGGMTANAYRLGTVLTLGWFWMRRAGCCVLYRGPSVEQIDLVNILAAAQQTAATISPPPYAPHGAGSACFYLVRRFNNCGYQERTYGACVKISIDQSGQLAKPQPNDIFAGRAEVVGGNKVRLIWFYCPLQQESEPARFKVYYDQGTGQIDYDNPLGVVAYRGRKFYGWSSDALDEGEYCFALRAEDAEGVQGCPAVLRATVCDDEPVAVSVLGASAV